MNNDRVKYVTTRFANNLAQELMAWEKIDEVANRIHEGAAGLRPINLHKNVKFEFVQKFDRERAAYIQDEISDILNADRWVS